MSRKLHYPKIPDAKNFPLGRCIAFEKYDGTNLHFRWDHDFGWHAYGTRRDEFNLDKDGIARFEARHPQLKSASVVFERLWSKHLSAVLAATPEFRDVGDVTVFGEFFGVNSFAGSHVQSDTKNIVVFDVEIDGVFLSPDEFVRHFEHLPIARVVYRGRLTGTFADNVRAGHYDVAEGVVCKSVDRSGKRHTAKIKTNEYLKRLKNSFGENWQAYWE